MEEIFLFKDSIYDKVLLPSSNSFENILQTQGFVVLKDIYRDQVNQYPIWIENIRNIIDKQEFNGSEVINQDNRIFIRHNKGRTDLSPITDLIELEISSSIQNILNRAMQCEFVCKSKGVLTLDAHTDSYGKWHRDTPSLFSCHGKNSKEKDLCDSDYKNICLPDYYFTVFIPLINVTIENGATEIIPGSHKLSVHDSRFIAKSYLTANRGDAVIMNGKLLHRSTPNLNHMNRDVIYMVYAPVWLDEKYT
jgi:ectoine hydroxylase-related dioxygenase (phytanoyl-CoA dioxygenase family)